MNAGMVVLIMFETSSQFAKRDICCDAVGGLAQHLLIQQSMPIQHVSAY
jgi:hypothetical protein